MNADSLNPAGADPGSAAVALLGDWLVELDDWWCPQGWFGSGYNHWGIQTSLKYAGAAAVVAQRHPDPQRRAFARERALATYRQSFATHVSGSQRCADGSQWGHTWISALALERTLHGVAALQDPCDDRDREALRRVLASEADWLSTDYHRGPERGVQAALWGKSGKNDPESNLWNGALLWRAVTLLADDPGVDAARLERWRERALEFLANGVSIAADAADTATFDGRRLADLHRGPNFFDSYSLDHHGYLNLGYMAICTSQAALLHFDQQAAGLPVPELLGLHQDRLWERIRDCITPDGRLVRIGGDSRVRYAYCQEFVPHSAMYAAAVLGDTAALSLARGHLDLVQQERDWTLGRGETGFYGARLARLRKSSPYYYLRLETDRANALSFVAVHADRLDWNATPPATPVAKAPVWSDDQHGFAMVRGERRLASYCWQAFTTTQGLCVPVNQGDLAEYHLNLTPQLDIEGQVRDFLFPHAKGTPPRTVLDRWIGTFDGGFATVGTVSEGTELAIAEGWRGGPAATSTIAFVALPDDATVLGVHRVDTADTWIGVREASGVNLQIPNDVANNGVRRLRTAATDEVVNGPSAEPRHAGLGSWAVIDEVLGVASLNGRDLHLHSEPGVGGGPFDSLGTETIRQDGLTERHYVAPGTTVVDSAFLVRVGTGDDLSDFGDQVASVEHGENSGPVRTWRIGRWFVAVNLGTDPGVVELPGPGTDLVSGSQTSEVIVPGCRATVVELATAPVA